MADFWQGKAHFQEVRNIDWAKPPYNSPHEGEGWFASPMPFSGGTWYLFDRGWFTPQEKPAYCPEPGFRVIVRQSTDQGQSWSNPAVVAAAPGPQSAPDACGTADGSTYYDSSANTWQMLTQCRAAHNAGGWMLCHYVRHGASPMGPFSADAIPSVRGGQLWSQICNHPNTSCDPHKTVDEGTPDIVFKKNGYFYVTFHGYDYATKHSVRGVAKTADFHNWITSAPDLPNGPIFAAPECQAWNPGCLGGGEASTLIAGDYQYMVIETPNKSFTRIAGQNWPFALLRAPQNQFPIWSSPLWQRFPRNPLMPVRTARFAACRVAYMRWATTADHVYMYYADYGCNKTGAAVVSVSANRLLELMPGRGPSVTLRAH
ncbi:MAG TPA: hypothetical protein VL985_07045 [Stellaceae bacterium]|nr:hypothetical protein [Stellaceae bacterium]